MTTTTVDTTALRLYYLQQLGITVYLPRADANADASGCDDEIPALVTSAVESAIVIEDSAVATGRQRLREMADTPAPPIASKQPAIAVREFAVTDAAAAETLASLQLLFAVVDAQLALAVQIPALAKPRLGDAEGRLLHNLLRWLGKAPPDAAWLQFRWPLPGMKAGSPAAAAKSLSLFLQQALSGHSVQHLLLLGQGLEHVTTVTELPVGNCRSWATHGLSEMLAVPALKREVWLQLLPLHGQLQKNRD